MATLDPAAGRFRIPPLRWASALGSRPAPAAAALAPLLAAHRAARPGPARDRAAEAELLRAYTVAERQHRGQLRKSAPRTSPIRWPSR